MSFQFSCEIFMKICTFTYSIMAYSVKTLLVSGN